MGITSGIDGAAIDAKLYNSSAVIQWLARKAMKRFLALLINSDLWAMFAAQKGCYSSHILFLLLLFFLFSSVTRSNNQRACGLQPVFSYVHEGHCKEPFVLPATLVCMLQFQSLQTKFHWKPLAYFLLCAHVFWKVIKLTV